MNDEPTGPQSPAPGTPAPPTGPQSPVPAQPPTPEHQPTGQELYPAGPVQPVQQQQAYRPPISHAQPTNGFAIASLVLGILWIFWVGSVLAIIFGHIATAQIAQSGGTQGGRGMAIAGFVLGYIGVGIFIVFFVLPWLFFLVVGGAASIS